MLPNLTVYTVLLFLFSGWNLRPLGFDIGVFDCLTNIDEKFLFIKSFDVVSLLRKRLYMSVKLCILRRLLIIVVGDVDGSIDNRLRIKDMILRRFLAKNRLRRVSF